MIDDLLLDDIKGMSALDASDMLPAVASSGAQMREAVSVVDRAALNEVSKGDQPGLVHRAGGRGGRLRIRCQGFPAGYERDTICGTDP